MENLSLMKSKLCYQSEKENLDLSLIRNHILQPNLKELQILFQAANTSMEWSSYSQGDSRMESTWEYDNTKGSSGILIEHRKNRKKVILSIYVLCYRIFWV